MLSTYPWSPPFHPSSSITAQGQHPLQPLQSLQTGRTPPRHSPHTMTPAALLRWVVKLITQLSLPQSGCPMRAPVLFSTCPECLTQGLAYGWCILLQRRNGEIRQRSYISSGLPFGSIRTCRKAGDEGRCCKVMATGGAAGTGKALWHPGEAPGKGITELEGTEPWAVLHQTEVLMWRSSWVLCEGAALTSSGARKAEGLAKNRLTPRGRTAGPLCHRHWATEKGQPASAAGRNSLRNHSRSCRILSQQGGLGRGDSF